MTAPANALCLSCLGATDTLPCPHCGWEPGLNNPPPALPVGQVLDGRYRIGRVLGHGGFGITYLALDNNLQLRLAIKEYLPRDSATRAPDGVNLVVFSGQAAEQFAYGLARFAEEARILAQFDQHPGIVTVKNFFHANGTAYCVMDYVDGITLRQYLDEQPQQRVSLEVALKLLMPVMDALRAIHKQGLLHRDIAPDNIYLTRDGRVKLLDFGAARFAAGAHSHSLSIILKPGYSPEEQYRARGKQGPWTDVYGLAATCYRAITATVPPDALDRLDADDLIPPSQLEVPITSEQEQVLLKGLAIKGAQRYQSVAEFQQAWHTGEVPAPHPVANHQCIERPAPAISRPAAVRMKVKLVHILALAGLILMLGMLRLALLPERPGPGKPIGTVVEGEAAFNRGDYIRARGILRPLALTGDPVAQFYFGRMYAEGRGLPLDEAEGAAWYRKAAEKGYAPAQNSLGVMYDRGKGVFENEFEAVSWYRKAAEQGLAHAQFNLGRMYARGRGVDKDPAAAADWFRKAAAQGDAAAKAALDALGAERP